MGRSAAGVEIDAAAGRGCAHVAFVFSSGGEKGISLPRLNFPFPSGRDRPPKRTKGSSRGQLARTNARCRRWAALSPLCPIPSRRRQRPRLRVSPPFAITAPLISCRAEPLSIGAFGLWTAPCARGLGSSSLSRRVHDGLARGAQP